MCSLALALLMLRLMPPSPAPAVTFQREVLVRGDPAAIPPYSILQLPGLPTVSFAAWLNRMMSAPAPALAVRSLQTTKSESPVPPLSVLLVSKSWPRLHVSAPPTFQPIPCAVVLSVL